MSKAREVFRTRLENHEKTKKIIKQESFLVANSIGETIHSPLSIPFLAPFTGRFKALLIKTNKSVNFTVIVEGEEVYKRDIPDFSLVKLETSVEFGNTVRFNFSPTNIDDVCDFCFTYVYEVILK